MPGIDAPDYPRLQILREWSRSVYGFACSRTSMVTQGHRTETVLLDLHLILKLWMVHPDIGFCLLIAWRLFRLFPTLGRCLCPCTMAGGVLVFTPYIRQEEMIASENFPRIAVLRHGISKYIMASSMDSTNKGINIDIGIDIGIDIDIVVGSESTSSAARNWISQCHYHTFATRKLGTRLAQGPAMVAQLLHKGYH